jgi:uncharacterized membrane protein
VPSVNIAKKDDRRETPHGGAVEVLEGDHLILKGDSAELAEFLSAGAATL